MVDNSKRQSMKSLGTLAALPLVPAAMIPSISHAVKGSHTATPFEPIEMLSDDEQLHIVLQLDGWPMMKVTNTSNTLTIVRRIYPGTVQVGPNKYDLNHALVGSAYAIGAGHTRLVPIAHSSNTHAETENPAKYSKKHLQTASVSASDEHGELLNATQVAFA